MLVYNDLLEKVNQISLYNLSKACVVGLYVVMVGGDYVEERIGRLREAA